MLLLLLCEYFSGHKPYECPFCKFHNTFSRNIINLSHLRSETLFSQGPGLQSESQ